MPEYIYAHVPTIRRFSESRAFIRGLMGPFGSGKSSGCVVEIAQWAARQHAVDGVRRSRFAIIRNTYGQLRDTSIQTWLNWLPEPTFGTYQKADHVYVLRQPLEDGTRSESTILFRALDRPEHVANLLSLELTGAWVNEAREVPGAVIKALQGRVDRYPSRQDGGCIDPGIIMDTNPPDDDSWWFRLFEDERPGNVEIFKQPSARSPEAENLANLSPDYYRNLATGADPDFIRVYIDGLYGYVKDGRPVYPEYNDNIHCSESVSPHPKVAIRRGWDFGLTPACVFAQVHPDGRFIVLDELTAQDLGIERFSDVVLEHCSERYDGYSFEDYGDPAGDSKAQTDERTCFEILRGKGIDISAGEQTLTLRLESVRKPLNSLANGKPQFQLHPRCKMLRKGFMGRYQYKRVRVSGSAERYHDEPDKNEYSHPHDGLQYIASKAFGAAVKGREKTKWLPMAELMERAGRHRGVKPYAGIV